MPDFACQGLWYSFRKLPLALGPDDGHRLPPWSVSVVSGGNGGGGACLLQGFEKSILEMVVGSTDSSVGWGNRIVLQVGGDIPSSCKVVSTPL